jgi:hypothetical protein
MTALDQIGNAYVTFVHQINKKTIRYLHSESNLDALGNYISEKLGEEAMTSSDAWLSAWVDLSGAGKLQEPPTAVEIAAEKAKKERDRIEALHERDRAPGRESRVFKSDEQLEKEAAEAVRKIRDNEAWLAFWPSHREYMSRANAEIIEQWLTNNRQTTSVSSLEAAFNATRNQLKNLVSREETTVFKTYHALGDVSIPFTRPQLLAWMKSQKSVNIIEVKKQYPHLAKRMDAVIVGFEDPMTPPAPPVEGINING